MPEIFADYQTSAVQELSATTGEPAWDVTCQIHGVDVQFLGERDTGEYVSKLLSHRLTTIELNDIEVPCFTLEAEAQTYAETHREHKARLIKTFLLTFKEVV